MPVKVADLKRDRRTITIDLDMGTNADGENVTEPLVLTYRPSAYTPNAELEFNEKLKGEWKSEMGLAFITSLVVSWDLEDDDGSPYPLDKDSLAALPSPFLGAVIIGISEDMGKDRASSNGS